MTILQKSTSQSSRRSDEKICALLALGNDARTEEQDGELVKLTGSRSEART